MWLDMSWHLREISVQVQYGRRQERAGSAFSPHCCSDIWKQGGKQWEVGRKRPELQSSSEKALAGLMRHLRAKTSKEPHPGQEGFSSSTSPGLSHWKGREHSHSLSSVQDPKGQQLHEMHWSVLGLRSPSPGPQTGMGPWPIRDPDTQQEVSCPQTGEGSSVFTATAHHSLITPKWDQLAAGRQTQGFHWLCFIASCIIRSLCITIEVKCTTDVIHLNHPGTIPHSPIHGKKYLPWNQSLAPSRLGTTALEWDSSDTTLWPPAHTPHISHTHITCFRNSIPMVSTASLSEDKVRPKKSVG